MRRGIKGPFAALLAILLLLSVLTGCSTVSAFLSSNFSGLPIWYYEPDIGSGKGNTGFVGEGQASTERQAELLAYSDIMDKLSNAIGYTLGQEVYRELSVLGTITQFGLSIEDRYTAVQEGLTSVYLHVVINSELLDQATTDESKRRTALVSEVENLVLEGDEYIKSGMEIKAVHNYMQAMAKGFGEDYIDEEYTFDELYDVVYALLDSITVSIQNAKPASISCTVAVTRKGTFVSSMVASADVLASYTAVDTRNVTYQDSFVFVTNSDGVFPFTTINPSISRSGTIRFSLNLESELKALEAVGDPEKVQALRSLVESKSIDFNYSRVYRLGTLAVSVIEHDTLGYVTGATDISDYLSDKMAQDGVEAAAFYPELDDEEDVLYEFQHSDRTENCLLVIRAGLIDTVSSDLGMYVANVEGLVTLFECERSETLYQSDVVYATAFGETEEDAIRGAFEILADMAYTLVKAVYV